MASTMNRIGTSALRGTQNSFRIWQLRTFVTPRAPRQPFHSAARLREGDRKDSAQSPSSQDLSESSSQAAPTETSDANASPIISSEDSPSIDASASRILDDAVKSLAASDDLSTPFTPARGLDEKPLTPKEIAEAEAFLANPPEEYKNLLRELKSTFSGIESTYSNQNVYTETSQLNYKDPIDRNARGLLSMTEPPDEQRPDEPYEGDDVTSLAHAQLDQHRELRQYMRVIAWEMPKLSQLVKPFQPPDASCPLRFRHTSYLGDSHPAENKIVVEFCTSDLKLAPAQRLKLVKLAGPRYDPQTDAIKLSCESFASQAQNKRYLGDVIQTLVRAAKGDGDSPEAKDSFEDVPVDFRHVKWKTPPEFPEEWKFTEERRQLLKQQRAHLAEREQSRIEDGEVVDGMAVIAESWGKRSQPAPEGLAQQARLDRISSNKRPGARL